MDTWYYAAADRQRQGPVTADDIRQLHITGAINLQTLVWREGLDNWCPLADLASELGLPPPLAAAGVARPDPYHPPGPAAAGPTVSLPPVPNHLVWAILSTLLCCWPMGVVAIVYSVQVERRRAEGNLQGALAASRSARLWALWSCLSIVLVVAVVFVLAAIDGAFR